MSDQAQMLRNQVEAARQKEASKMRVITVTSGKGGVGKSNFVTNIAMALGCYSRPPVILDADFGLANVEIIYGQRPQYNLSHLIHKKCTLEQIITPTTFGVSFISGGSGVRDMLFLSPTQLDYIGDELSKLERMTDTLLIDTGAGINEVVLKFCAMADEVFLIVTPEPASITDAYALIKTLVKDFSVRPEFKVIINKASSKQEAHEVFHKINYVSSQFLEITLQYAGYVPFDQKLFESVKAQKPVLAYDEKCAASCAYKAIARSILQIEEQPYQETLNWRQKFKQIFNKR